MKNKILGKPEVNQIIGMSKEDAITQLKSHNYTMRVINENGEALMTNTLIYEENRVNVFLVNNKVNDIRDIG